MTVDSMAQDAAPLVWVDMEMSGLVPDRDRILEVAIVVTGADLEVIAEDLFEREPLAILESFLLMMQHQELRGMTAPTLRSIAGLPTRT